MSDELYALLYGLLVADLSDLDEGWELEVLPGHLLDKWLHRCRKHQKSFEVLLARAHLVFLMLDERFFITLMQVLRDLINAGIDRVLQVVVNHLIGLVKHHKVALVEDQRALGKEVFDSTGSANHDFDAARDD